MFKRFLLSTLLIASAFANADTWSLSPFATQATCTAAAASMPAGTYQCSNTTTTSVPVVVPPPITPPPTVVPLPSVSVTAGSAQGVDAPSDTDYAAGYTRFYEKGQKIANGPYASNTTFGFTPTALSQFTTISVKGVPRFMYETVDGLPTLRQTIVRGDLQYPSGLRAGRALEGAQSVDGESVYVAMAIKLDPSWVSFMQTSGQSCEIFSIHSGGTGLAPYYGVQLMVGILPVKGGAIQKPPGWLTVPKRDGSGDAGIYNWALNYGGWQRIIVHYVTGASGLVEMWVANGAGPYTALQPASWNSNNGNASPGTTYSKNLSYGDPTAGGGTQGKDYLKAEFYTFDGFTGMPNNTATGNVSDVYYGKAAQGWGYANAVAALAQYAK